MVAINTFLQGVPMTAPSRLSHAVLRSHDVPRLMDWYLKVTEGHLIFDGFGMAFMTYDDEHHRLGIVPIDGDDKPVDKGRPGLVHLAFAWPTVPELVANYARLRDLGIYPRITVNHGLTLSFYYQDPDNNSVECVCDLLPSEEATELMHTEYYRRNPVGLLWDPEELRERVEAGLDPAELTATYKATEVDVPSALAECRSFQDMSAEEFNAKFEAQLAARK
jgi:hypothetical protein